MHRWFGVLAVEGGLMKIVMKLKDLLLTVYVTSVNVLCELVLILNHWNGLLLCSGLLGENESSTKKDIFCFK